MAYLRQGQVVGKRPSGFLDKIIHFFVAIFEFLVVFFKTIIDPGAADPYVKKGRSSGGSGPYGGGGGGPPRPPRGPRITGLSDLRDAGGNCAAGA